MARREELRDLDRIVLVSALPSSGIIHFFSEMSDRTCGPFSDLAPEAPDMPALLRRLLELVSVDSSDAIPVRAFAEIWKGAQFANSRYAVFVRKTCAYLLNPELNLRRELFEANVEAVLADMRAALAEAGAVLDAADPARPGRHEDEYRVARFVNDLLAL